MATHVQPGVPALAEPIQRGGEGEEASTRAERIRTAASTSSHSGETLTEPKPEQDEEKAMKEDNASTSPENEKKEEKDPYLVTLEGRDHLNPHTWPVWYRWWLTAFAGILVLNASEFRFLRNQVYPLSGS